MIFCLDLSKHCQKFKCPVELSLPLHVGGKVTPHPEDGSTHNISLAGG